MFSQLEWIKLDHKSTVISRGDKMMNGEYLDRGNVHVNTTASVLSIDMAEDEDAGQYQCVIRKGEVVEQVTHNVVLKGKYQPCIGRNDNSYIKGTPLIHSKTPSVIFASPGDDVTLTCETSGTYPATVRWTPQVIIYKI